MMKNTINRVISWVRGLPLKYSVGGGAALLIVLVLGIHFATRTSSTAEAVSTTPHVHISSIAGLSSQSGPLPVVGKVTSLNEATILAQSSGEITVLNRKLGDKVAAGSVIAQFENSSQSAAVLQATGSYEAAQAALAKVTGSTAANTNIGLSSANQTLANTTVSAGSSMLSAYGTLDDAVHVKADALFSNPRSPNPAFNLSVPDYQLSVNIVNQRIALEGILADAKANASATGDIDASINALTADAQKVNTFLTDLVTATNKAIPNQSYSASDIVAYQSSIAAARSSVVTAISTLATAKSSYDAAKAGVQTAGNTAGSGADNDAAAAQASVKTALGALRAAQAALEKTIIRSPISGTIVSLPITRGDFVSSFSQVAVVSNPGALEVVTNVTPDDAKTIAVGGRATIEGGISGVIVSIAPALDPLTNKIEVKIGLSGSSASLTDGESVTLSIDRITQTGKTKAATALTIPITATKITPQGPVVFTVESNALVAHPVTLGSILGDQVVLSGGASADMAIVTDARGLSEGETVIVDAE